jgi:hypothetical protein
LSLVSDGPDVRWSYSGTDASGVYAVQVPGGQTRQFAVNVDPREGDLARFDPELLTVQFNRESQSDGQPLPPLAGSPGRSLFRWLLAGMLVLLVLEPILAWHFGRGRG